jgi:hypothetical protein
MKWSRHRRGPPTLPRRARARPHAAGVGYASHDRLHAGSAAVPRDRRRRRRRCELCQHTRKRRLVRRGRKGGTKDGGAAGGSRNADAGHSFCTAQSAGVALVYGRDERAIEASSLLKEHLDITVLITRPGDLTPPRTTDFPIVKGTIRAAKGHLGAFEVDVDDYALPRPSSRGALTFGPARDGAASRCDIMLDIALPCHGCN